MTQEANEPKGAIPLSEISSIASDMDLSKDKQVWLAPLATFIHRALFVA
jgi:hypothetical protein